MDDPKGGAAPEQEDEQATTSGFPQSGDTAEEANVGGDGEGQGAAGGRGEGAEGTSSREAEEAQAAADDEPQGAQAKAGDEAEGPQDAASGEEAPAAPAGGAETTQAEDEQPEAAEGPQVTTEVEETGPCARRVRVAVPEERVQQEIDKSYEELRNTVFIKGFRKGRVPRHVLERRFGEEVLESVKQTLVDEGFHKALDDHSLELAVPPDIDIEAIAIQPGQPLDFEVGVEVEPQFTIDNYRGLEVERLPVEVTDADVDRAVEGFRMQHGEYRTIADGQVGETDVPVCHAIALQDGQELWRDQELGANLPGGTLGGMAVPGLKDQLLGAQVGDTRTFHLTLPDDFSAEEHRGKEVDLEVTVDELRRFEAPEPTDEWAESIGFDDLEDLRDELSDELRRRREQEADEAVHRRIEDQLLQLTDFDVPPGLVDRMVSSVTERQRMALLYHGAPQEQIDEALARQEGATREHSVRQCKLYFILHRIAEQEKIFVTEDEVDQRIQAIALNYRRRPEEIASELERTGRMSSLRRQMREEKVRDFLVQQAHIAEAEGQQAPADDQPPPEPEE
ncbi:MAG: trigger factor [Candidatus Brocadiia bacterium]